MNINEILGLVQELCIKANVPKARCTFECTGNVAGTFTYGKSDCYLDFNTKFFDEKDYRVTVIHEVAHYVRYVRNGNKVDMHGKHRDIHGNKWKSVMIELGIKNPTPYHTYANITRRKQRRWEYICGCTKHRIATVTHIKMLKGQNRSCTLCNNKLIFTGKEL